MVIVFWQLMLEVKIELVMVVCSRILKCISVLKNNKLNLPNPCRLLLTENYESDPLHSGSVPFVFVADDAFQLTRHCMKHYGRKNITDAKRIFEYHLSRKRRVTENAFGILVKRFRVFSVQNNLNENNVSIVVLASLSLHNLLRERSRDTYTPPGFTDEIQMDDNMAVLDVTKLVSSEFLCPLETTKQNRYSKNAEEIRTTLKDCFCGPGEVPLQWKVLI